MERRHINLIVSVYKGGPLSELNLLTETGDKTIIDELLNNHVVREGLIIHYSSISIISFDEVLLLRNEVKTLR